MPYGDLVKQKVQRFAGDRGPRPAPVHDRGARGVRAAHRGGRHHLRRAWTTVRSCARPRRRPTSSSGTAATTTCRSTARTSRSWWPTRTGPGHETTYHPGETNLRRAHVVVINKIDSAGPEGIEAVRRSIRELNPGAVVVDAASPLSVDGAEQIRGKRVLAVEDGPDPDPRRDEVRRRRPRRHPPRRGRDRGPAPLHGRARITKTFEKYPGIGTLLPAMGYGEAAGEGPRGDDRADAVRRRARGHPHRPAPRHRDPTSPPCGWATSCRRSASPTSRTCSRGSEGAPWPRVTSSRSRTGPARRSSCSSRRRRRSRRTRRATPPPSPASRSR